MESAPPYVEAECAYPELLEKTGWKVIDRMDVSAAYEETGRRHIREVHIEAVPDDYCDQQALVGPPQRIRDRYKEWENSGATGLILSGRRIEGLELMAELTGSRDRVA